MILSLKSRRFDGQVYVDLITGFIYAGNAESHMVSGIIGKSKQNLRFLYSPDLLKKRT